MSAATLALSTDLLVNEPLAFPPVSAVPPADAELVGMIHEFLALKAPRDAEFAALNSLSKRTPGLRARWDAWREGAVALAQLEKRIARTPAVTPEGALLKAKLGAILLSGGDVEGADMAADDGQSFNRIWGMACAGIADLLRLKGMLSSPPVGGLNHERRTERAPGAAGRLPRPGRQGGGHRCRHPRCDRDSAFADPAAGSCPGAGGSAVNVGRG